MLAADTLLFSSVSIPAETDGRIFVTGMSGRSHSRTGDTLLKISELGEGVCGFRRLKLSFVGPLCWFLLVEASSPSSHWDVWNLVVLTSAAVPQLEPLLPVPLVTLDVIHRRGMLQAEVGPAQERMDIGEMQLVEDHVLVWAGEDPGGG